MRTIFYLLFVGIVLVNVQTKDLASRTSSHQYPDLEFKCKNRIGYFADLIRECKVFYLCTKEGLKYDFVCPPTLVFDEKSSVCKRKENVECKKPKETNVLKSPSHKYPKDLEFECQKDADPNLYYADTIRDCCQFYRCVNGMKYEFTCPTGLAFDSKMQTCLLKKYVKCERKEPAEFSLFK
ncbi:peritrophin-1-like [Tachypleus tridentatus]|uniref:peritrophin-1-like n=1 Tax=Tachypleus tridentatus TaxID=6853 RepID=UPI003FD2162B